ncbi:hypothetical protein GCM10023185_42930 [Hymenobacter saemangeumensis]|uniref:Uncharacterized protein n=1 Tax=Hymenobacter saemangeumensis TaxID=1084522 RepID=A0ABP8IRW4_9BACT
MAAPSGPALPSEWQPAAAYQLEKQGCLHLLRRNTGKRDYYGLKNQGFYVQQQDNKKSKLDYQSLPRPDQPGGRSGRRFARGTALFSSSFIPLLV